MSRNTQNKTQHYGFAVIGEKLRMAEPAATEETALARASKIAEKAGAGKVPTLSVEADSRDEARKLASVAWNDYSTEETGEAFEPSEAELADAAAEAPAADPAATAASRTRKSGWYNVGVRDGETVASVVPERDSATAQAVAFDAEKVVTIKAKNRDEAINRYESLDGNLPESGIVTGSAPRARKEQGPVEGGDTLATWVPKESKTQTYFVSKGGLLHSDKTCRFVRETTPTMKVPTKDLVETVLRNREDHSVEVPKSPEGILPRHLCAFCTGTKRVAADDAA